MQATRNRPKPKLSQIVAEFPRKHLLAASCVIAALFASLLLTPGKDAQATRISQPVDLQLSNQAAPTPAKE